METVKLNHIKYKKLLKSESLAPGKYVYLYNDELLKIYSLYKYSYYSMLGFNMYVDNKQIEYLSDMQQYIKLSHLPKGIVKYKDNNIGVIYDYFENYKSFFELHKEDKTLMFDNIKSSIDAMNELVYHNIFNTDIVSQNILYKGNDVELIDLDGPYIHFDGYKLNDVYKNFLYSTLNILKEKLLTQYNNEEVAIILKDIKQLLGLNGVYIDSVSTEQIDKIENLKLIR